MKLGLGTIEPIVAHQYGWDEVLMFAIPVILAITGVRIAEQRAKKKREAESEAAHHGDE